MVVLLLNGSAAVWAVWLVGGERQRAERSEKVEQAECVKTDSLKKGRGCQARLRILESGGARDEIKK